MSSLITKLARKSANKFFAHNLLKGLGGLSVKNIRGPYFDTFRYITYQIGSSEFQKATTLVGDEAEDLLLKYGIEAGMPYAKYQSDHFGTPDNPVLIPSLNGERVFACEGHSDHPHDTLWSHIKEGEIVKCQECEQVFKCVVPQFKVVVHPIPNFYGAFVNKATPEEKKRFEAAVDAMANPTSAPDVVQQAIAEYVALFRDLEVTTYDAEGSPQVVKMVFPQNDSIEDIDQEVSDYLGVKPAH